MGEQLGVEERRDIRMFAFAVANGNLLCHLLDDDELEPDYLAAIQREPSLLAALFTAFLSEEIDPERWLLEQLRDPFGAPSLLPTLRADAPRWMETVISFADALAEDRLEGVPEPSRLIYCGGGSPLERVFAVFTNLLEVDPHGQPLRPTHARSRAAEMALWLLERTPPAVPFSPEETLLV